MPNPFLIIGGFPIEIDTQISWLIWVSISIGNLPYTYVCEVKNFPKYHMLYVNAKKPISHAHICWFVTTQHMSKLYTSGSQTF